ncbi:hypothetical protein FA15DRAFT_81642 [Coprinopsis marcescibilis]|uniref:Uncharacterized protein n=1 Tax=Coprinopsis marcescibilis TaxID=230819 RepID=A0A5C3KZI5_COPMA|nr:hypothetical protein FA15DRAFT_81642 [Coprinopsis marcescibilis]
MAIVYDISTDALGGLTYHLPDHQVELDGTLAGPRVEIGWLKRLFEQSTGQPFDLLLRGVLLEPENRAIVLEGNKYDIVDFRLRVCHWPSYIFAAIRDDMYIPHVDFYFAAMSLTIWFSVVSLGDIYLT